MYLLQSSQECDNIMEIVIIGYDLSGESMYKVFPRDTDKNIADFTQGVAEVVREVEASTTTGISALIVHPDAHAAMENALKAVGGIQPGLLRKEQREQAAKN